MNSDVKNQILAYIVGIGAIWKLAFITIALVFAADAIIAGSEMMGRMGIHGFRSFTEVTVESVFWYKFFVDLILIGICKFHKK